MKFTATSLRVEKNDRSEEPVETLELTLDQVVEAVIEYALNRKLLKSKEIPVFHIDLQHEKTTIRIWKTGRS